MLAGDSNHAAMKEILFEGDWCRGKVKAVSYQSHQNSLKTFQDSMSRFQLFWVFFPVVFLAKRKN